MLGLSDTRLDMKNGFSKKTVYSLDDIVFKNVSENDMKKWKRFENLPNLSPS